MRQTLLPAVIIQKTPCLASSGSGSPQDRKDRRRGHDLSAPVQLPLWTRHNRAGSLCTCLPYSWSVSIPVKSP